MPTGLLEYTSPTVPAALTGYLAPGVEFEISNANVVSDLTNAAVLITFTDNAYLGQACADGRDLRFTNADGTTVLDHQKISFSIASGLATGSYTVKCTPTTAAAAKIRCYCSGDTGDTDTSTTDVWDANYKGVGPLSETGTGSAGDYQDLTVSNHDSVNTTNQPTAISGPVAGVGASNFDGSSYVQIAEGVTVGGTGFTIEGLCKFAAWNNDANFIAQRQNPNSIQVSTMAGGELRLSLWLESTETAFDTVDADLSVDTWYYVAATYNGTNVIWRVYDASGQIHEQTFSDTRSIDSNIGYTWFASNSWSAVPANLGFWRISNSARSEALITFTAAQLLMTGSQLTVSNVVGTWAAVDAGDITGKVILACDVATTSTAAWAEVEDPERANYILNASGVYVDRYTLTTAQWRACLIPMWKSTLSDDAETLRRVGQISTDAAKLPARVRYFSGDVVYPYDVPFATQVVQTPADAAQRWPEYERDIS
jgi:hypothetical protein